MTDDRRKQNASNIHTLWKELNGERIAIIGGNGLVLRYGITVNVEGPFKPGDFHAVLSKFEKQAAGIETSFARLAKLNRIAELKNLQRDLEAKKDD